MATAKECKEIRDEVQAFYDKSFEESKTWEVGKDDWLSSKWSGFKSPGQISRIRETGIHQVGMQHSM